jgi:hypothetical protein
MDDPTVKPGARSRMGGARSGGRSSPAAAPDRRREGREGPRKPTLDEMGPGPQKESKPYRPGPRSTTGRPGMRGGWRPRGR